MNSPDQQPPAITNTSLYITDASAFGEEASGQVKTLTTFSISMGTGIEVGSSDKVVEAEHESSKVTTETDEPKVGMLFNDDEELFEYFKLYARRVGFPIRKRSKKKDADGTVRYVAFACALEGRNDPKSNKLLSTRPFTRTGCRVKVSARFELDKWLVTKVELNHNHQIIPTASRYYKCNREKSSSSNKRTGNDEGENLCKHHNEKVKRLRVTEGDILAIQNYFLKMQEQTTGFFFSMDHDKEGQLKNVFWADGRSRKAYKEFGEIITFDTTYLTNKYEVPIVLFLGVNHHGQSSLLGCGFVSDENVETFVWLFRMWLVSVGHCDPQGIITDQNKQIQSAIETVLPNSRHRWCLWHVMKKLPKMLTGQENCESIIVSLENAVYDTQSPTEFECSWSEVIDKYGLHQNDSLSGLFKDRHRWVPCYVKSNFWAGMSTTQRNESITPFFDGYVNPKTTMEKFIEQYEKAMKNKVEKEAMLDLKSSSQMPPCVTTFEMERQIQSVYSIPKFKEFQNELTGQLYCRQNSAREGYMVSEYDIREDIVVGEGKRRMVYTVSFKVPECDIRCSCHMFEFSGILCRHVIFVLLQSDVVLIPDKYIVRRWRKDVRRCHARVRMNYDNLDSTPEQLRYDQLRLAVTEVAELAAEDEDHYHEVMKWVDYLKKNLPMSKSSGGSNNIAPKSAVDMNFLFES